MAHYDAAFPAIPRAGTAAVTASQAPSSAPTTVHFAAKDAAAPPPASLEARDAERETVAVAYAAGGASRTLTVSLGPAAKVDAGALRKAALAAIAASLAEGEAARASGDTSKLLQSLQRIGERYAAEGKGSSAAMFFLRALELARSAGDAGAELQCLGELGRCEEQRGDLGAAAAHHALHAQPRAVLGTPLLASQKNTTLTRVACPNSRATQWHVACSAPPPVSWGSGAFSMDLDSVRLPGETSDVLGY
jgi:hypothetical protein